MNGRIWDNRWVRVVLIVAGIVVFGLVLRRLSEPLSPFAAAFAAAYFLNPAVNALERVFTRLLRPMPLLQRWVSPRAAAVGLLCVVVVVFIVGVIAIVVPKVYQQVAYVVAKLPDYARTVRERVEPLIHRLDVRYPEQSEEVRKRLEEAARTYLPEIVVPITMAIRSAFSSVLGFVLAVLNLVIVPIFAVYLLFDMNHIVAGIKELVPHRLRPYMYSRMGRVGTLLSAFVRGQITVCLILGTFYAISLTACGVPMGIPVGLLIGFFNLIPFMSYVLGLPLALVLSWLDDQDPTRVLIVAVLFTIGQFVEGNFITPRIVGDSLGLHAVIVMLAVLVGGSLFGVVGMLLALPVTAVLSVFWEDLHALYLRSDFYSRGAPEA